MVTHNPELANEYSNRIISLKDGKIVDDTNYYDGKEDTEEKYIKPKKTSMNFFTALSLSRNNLLTKKGRTFFTAFAGSIGIIGIALILSLSNGVDKYIEKVQEDALTSYPLSLEKTTIDASTHIKRHLTYIKFKEKKQLAKHMIKREKKRRLFFLSQEDGKGA
jgi:putative ABC transport system permease protein